MAEWDVKVQLCSFCSWRGHLQWLYQEISEILSAF